MNSPEKLLNRALHLICGEWGLTHDDAMRWLNDNPQWGDADTCKPSNSLRFNSVPGAFVQVLRKSEIPYPSEHALDAAKYAEAGRPSKLRPTIIIDPIDCRPSTD